MKSLNENRSSQMNHFQFTESSYTKPTNPNIAITLDEIHRINHSRQHNIFLMLATNAKMMRLHFLKN